MGCFQAKERVSSCSSVLFIEKFKVAIDNDSRKKLELLFKIIKSIFKTESVPFIDSGVIREDPYKFNPLAYALYKGAHNTFRFLYEKGASLNAMDEILDSQNLWGINLLCQKGHIELLKYYLPIFLSRSVSISTTEKSFTLDFRETAFPIKRNRDLALHSACKAGTIGVVNFLFQYFKSKPFMPKDFDFEAVDEENGENAALIACRTGNFPLIKVMHEVCKADFKAINVHKEHAILVCISGYKRKPSLSFIECVHYLVEVVGVDVTYMCDEMLLMADNPEMVKYLEMKLEEKGVMLKKKDLDPGFNEYVIRVQPEIDNSKQPIFTEEARKYLNEHLSFVSSISETASRGMDSSDIITHFR
jgi:ankyrin repeat protein